MGLNHNGIMIAFSDKSFCSFSSTISQKENRKTEKCHQERYIAQEETATFVENVHWASSSSYLGEKESLV